MDGKVYKRALVTCIAMLLLSIVFKLFGVQWFNLNTDIPLLQEIDKMVMTSTILSFLYSFVLRFINGYFIYLLATKNTRPTIILVITVIVSMISRPYINNDVLMILLDFNILLIPCFNKCKIREYYLVMFLNLIYQTLSLFIRDLGYQSCNYGLIVSLLLNLDYYIMCFITFLYLMKGDYTLCGIAQAFYSSLASKLWRKPSENYLNRDGK